MPKISIALSGGGSRCISQLGVMKYLEECGVEISAVSGSSAGAIIAGLYASGKSIDEIFSMLNKIDFKSHLKYGLKDGALYHTKDAIDYFKQVFGDVDIKDLDIPFYCAVTDYESGEVEYKTQGDLVTLMMASSALVPVFAPIIYEDRIFVDGGFCDNLPSLPLKSISDRVIGVNVNPISSNIKNSFVSHIKRSMFIMLNVNVKAGAKRCDLFIEVEAMGNYSIFDLKKFELFFDLGYNEAKKYQRQIEELF